MGEYRFKAATSISVDADLLREFRRVCASRGKSMSEVVEALMRFAIDSRGNPKVVEVVREAVKDRKALETLSTILG